jgi:hypothetical protein
MYSLKNGSPPLVADGNTFSQKGTSYQFDEQLRANDEQLRGVSIKRSYVRKNKSSIYERFHNFGVRFDAKIQHKALFNLEPCQFGRTKYKRLNFPEAIVKVFKESILITLRANQEIKGMKVRDAELESIRRVNVVLDKLPKAIVVNDRDVVNVHNAFVNHPLAKYNLNVKVDNETRLITDHSKGLNEFEAVNPNHAITDSECIETDIVSLIDKGLSRDFLASSIHKLVQDREYYAENLKSHVQAINMLSQKVSELNLNYANSPLWSEEISVFDKSISIPPTFSKSDVENKTKAYRMFRAQQLLKETGWGLSRW